MLTKLLGLTIIFGFLSFDAIKFEVPVGIHGTRKPESGSGSLLLLLTSDNLCFVRIFDKFVAFVKES